MIDLLKIIKETKIINKILILIIKFPKIKLKGIAASKKLKKISIFDLCSE